MTEDYWLQLASGLEMVDYIADRTSPRKLRLFAAACCAAMGETETAAACERAAEGSEDLTTLRLALPRSGPAPEALPRNRWSSNPLRIGVSYPARQVAGHALGDDAAVAARAVARAAFPHLQRDLTALVHEVFGNPFHPTPADAVWLRWNDGILQDIAQPIYDLLAWDRLGILADALEDAGCDNDDLIAHCRSAGPHVRGCWVLDAILGRS